LYHRFITQFINEDQEVETGIFHALSFICEHSLTLEEDKLKLKNLNGWFNANVDKPNKFSMLQDIT
jgi:hypothetical protein